MTTRLAYLGPPGTFTEEAALRYDKTAHLLPSSSIPEVGRAVETEEADQGVVPIENSLEGSVPNTLDLLIHGDHLFIAHELVLPIKHCLLAREGTRLEDIEMVYSHPQALAQCRRFLGTRLPGAALVASLSTSAAVGEMKVSASTAAAVGNARAASLYGVAILARGIEDDPGNLTRFVVLAPADHVPTGRDKTSVCFSFADDAPGLLYSALGELAQRGINLAKVESRPTRKSLGRYFFLLDLEGHREDSIVREALDGLGRRASMFKTLGSYPRYEPPRT